MSTAAILAVPILARDKLEGALNVRTRAPRVFSAAEIELVVAALIADRHVVIEGPPGTGKSTVLRAIAGVLHTGFLFVEGNAELTPARRPGRRVR